MGSPIFTPFFIKKYIDQIRDDASSQWGDHSSYMSFYQDECAVQQLIRQKSLKQGRILNRYTGHVVQVYAPQK